VAESTKVQRPAPARRGGGADRRRSAARRLAEVTELPAPAIGGRSLSPELQQAIAPRLGRDLSGIRLHHDWFAAQLTDALDADAVTHSDDIYFGQQAADPSTPAGRALLVHELYHAIAGESAVDAAGSHHEEFAAERFGLAAARDDLTMVPLQWPGVDGVGPVADHVTASGQASSSDLATSSGRALVQGAAVPPGRLGRLGRRAKATLTRRGPDDDQIPDVISAGDALVRLVERLFNRDPDDHGGRLAGVLGRLEHSLREAVVTVVADRNGGHVRDDLREVAESAPPEDGGYTQPVNPAAQSGETQPDDAQASVGRPADASDADKQSAGTAAADTVVGKAAAVESAGAGTAGVDSVETPAPPSASSGLVPEPADQLGNSAEAGESTDEQPPAPATIDASTVDNAPPPVAASSGGTGVVAERPAPAPSVPATGGDAPVTVADQSAGGPGFAGGPPAIDGQPAQVPAGERAAEEPVTRDEPAETGPIASDSPASNDQEQSSGLLADEAGPVEAPVAEPPLSTRQAAAAEPVAEPEAGATPTAAATTAEPASGDAAANAATPEPADPPEIANPPAPENDESPALPEAPVPMDDPAAPGAEAPSTDVAAQPETATAAMDSLPVEADVDAAGVSTSELDAPDAAPGGGSTDSAGDQGVAAAEEPSTAGRAGPDTGVVPAAADTEPVLSDPPVPSGGGGGGAAIADRPAPTTPDVSAMPPGAALAAVSSMPVSTLAASLGGVAAAAAHEVSDGEADLAANPPSMERPSGVPADKDASLPPAPLPPLPVAADRTLAPIAGGPGAPPPTPGTPPPAPAPVTLQVPEAKSGGDTQISAEDASRIQSAVKALPTSDPALDVDAGPVPELVLTGGEDPQQIGDQAKDIETATAGARADGLADARADMGENDVLPQVPKETLTADVSGATPVPAGGSGPAKAGAAPAMAGPGKSGPGPADPADAGGAAVSAAAIDAIAAEQGADQINAATQTQGSAIGAARNDHDSSVEQAKADTDKQINDEIAANGGEQTEARRSVRTAVGKDRKDWVGEQNKVTGESRAAANAATKQADDAVTDARNTARTDAAKAIKDGNDDIAEERAKAEQKARAEREKAKQESEDGGFFSWLGSKVKSFIDSVKSVIHAAFELARKAVDAVISTVQKLAVAAIELGRKAVDAAIDIAGKALMAAGDIALAAFPEARDRFRATIKEKVDGAKKAVNELADQLKAGVTKLLDGLGKLLKGALTLLENAYTAAIDAVGKVVDTVIKAAKAVVDALLDFAALVADIASDPIQWLRNLGAGLMDGVRNYVWPSLVIAVKNWFKSKVEEVVGVGTMILDLLRKGGITFGNIVTMAWTAIKESLPGILIQLLIEKLVALLIPAGGAIALIIDGIKAAWGAASKILAAFQKFIAFLKAVKPGNSGPLFGQLVGLAAVAVMDFLANFVLSKLKGAGEKVGGTLRKIADRIMKSLKKVVGAVKTGAKAAVGLAKKGTKAVAGVLKSGAKAVANVVQKGAKAVATVVKKVLPKSVIKAGGSVVKKVVGAVKKGVDKVKQGYRRAKEKLFGKKDNKKSKPKETKQQKLDRAVARTQLAIDKLAAVGAGRLRWTLTLAWLKRRWKWKTLAFTPSSKGAEIAGEINPSLKKSTTPTISITSKAHLGAAGSIEFLEVNETITVKYGDAKGEAKGEAAFAYEALITKDLSRTLLENLPDLEHMSKLAPSVMLATGKRGGGLETSDRALSTAETVIPHAQKGFRRGGKGERIGDVVAEVPSRNTAVLIEAQLAHDYGAIDPNPKRQRKLSETASDKIAQFDLGLKKAAERISSGKFAEQADQALQPRIVVIIVAPKEADAKNTVPVIKKQIENFLDSQLGAKFFVQVIWVTQPTKFL